MRRVLPVLFLLSLAACGADGEPVPPPAKETAKPGLTVSGDASMGVTVSQ